MASGEEKACKRAVLSSGTTWAPSMTPTTYTTFAPTLRPNPLRHAHRVASTHFAVSKSPPHSPPAPVTHRGSNYLSAYLEQNMESGCLIKPHILLAKTSCVCLFIPVLCIQNVLLIAFNDPISYIAVGGEQHRARSKHGFYSLFLIWAQ